MKRKILCVFAYALTLISSQYLIAPTAVSASSGSADSVSISQAQSDQIVRLYITALGRYPDAEGLSYWAARSAAGESLVDLARVMIASPEAQLVTSGDFVVDAYRNALGRLPDAEGHAYWLSFDDPARAVASIADSVEHQKITGTLPPPVSSEATTSLPNDVVLPEAKPVTANPATTGSADSASISQAQSDQIVRLYITALGRYPDAEGLSYWAARSAAGESLVDLARVMIASPEAQLVTSGDFVVDAYRNALGRLPDAEGHAYWLSFDDPARAVVDVADSVEHQKITGTLPPPENVGSVQGPKINPSPAGWVDAGSGVYVPPVLLSIRYCESKDSYTAANRRSSARGAYQFLTSSWAAYGHADRYGVTRADHATPAQQDEAAVITWRASGTRPWNASRHCWG